MILPVGHFSYVHEDVSTASSVQWRSVTSFSETAEFTDREAAISGRGGQLLAMAPSTKN